MSIHSSPNAPRCLHLRSGSLRLMKQPITLIGVGEMGSVFSHALLRSGHPVFPILRSTSMTDAVRVVPEPALALVTVGEDDLHESLDQIPGEWRSQVGLIQNELLPRDWQRHGIASPTVAVVWFEKKQGRATKVLIPTPIAGPHAVLLVDALTTIGIPAEPIPDEDLTDELVAKNLYILTANIAGLRTGGTVSELWNDHRPLAGAVASEILQIQEWLVGAPVDPDRAIEGMVRAIEGDPDHGTTGRSAPRRLERAIDHARSVGIETPTLIEIGREAGLPV
jgi:hypothetical protein